MSDPLYSAVNPDVLGRYYLRHFMAIEEEGLTSRSKIAAQLAIRDRKIDELQQAQEGVLLRVTTMPPNEIERSVRQAYPNAGPETLLLIWCPPRDLPETMAYAVVHDDATRRSYEELAHGLSLFLVRTRQVYLLESKG